MAMLVAVQTQNDTDATWKVASSAAENDSEAANATVPTTGGGTSDSSTFVLPATQVEYVAVKLNSRSASPSGTFTVSVRNSTSPGTRDGSVTVNVSDLEAFVTGNGGGGWYIFKFASPFTPNGTDSYVIRMLTSVSSMITAFASTGNNWSRQVVLTTTAAPGANDRRIVGGYLTGTGSWTSNTVTMNQNASGTTFGSTSAGAFSFDVCSHGTLAWKTNAATYLKLAGRFQVTAGGTVSGTVTGTNTATLEMVPNAAVDTGIEIRQLGTWNLQGPTITVLQCKLAADAAVSATSLTTTVSTSWLNTWSVALASTTKTASECESKALTADASGTTLTISALTSAHSGTNNANGDIRAELGLLTRYFVIKGTSSSLNTYINVAGTASFTMYYVEVTNCGSATANKTGISTSTATGGTFDLQYCSLHDFTVASSVGVKTLGTAGGTVTISNNVIFNTANCCINITATTAVYTISSNLCIRVTDSNASVIQMSDVGSTYTNNIAVGSNSAAGFVFGETNGTFGTFSGNVAHSNAGSTGLLFSSICFGGTVSNFVAWRNNTYGINIATTALNLVFDTCTYFGNGIAGFAVSSGASLLDALFTSCVFDAGATLTQTIGIIIGGGGSGCTGRIVSCTFGATNTHISGDIQISSANASFTQLVLHNCLLNSTTQVSTPSGLTPNGYIASQKHNQTNGSYRCWTKYGLITVDSTIYDVTPGLRVTPTSASNKAVSAPVSKGIILPVASGTALTVSVKVRKSVVGDGAAYNGNQPRLMVRRNDSLGITSDTVLATAAGAAGSFETLSGTTATVTDKGALEFYVDGDGTAGWFDVDTWSATGMPTDASGSLTYWFEGCPIAAMNGNVVSATSIIPVFGGHIARRS